MKKNIILSMLIVAVGLYSCGGGPSPEQSISTPKVVSNAEIAPVTMEGKPIPKEEASANKSGIDVNAKSDSKGVGKFTDVKISPTIDAALAKKGEGIFKTSCTACHLPTDKRLVGPGLLGITKIRTPEWIMNMITGPSKMTHNDPIAKALLHEYNNVQMTNQNVGDDGARAIYEFLRKNDSGSK